MDEQATARQRAALGAAFAGIGVALGAFGTHSLRDRVTPRNLEIFQTGVQYQTVHGLAIIVLAVAGVVLGRSMKVPTALMAFGIVIFGGSLYALALGAPRILGAVAPIGGASLIAAWAIAAYLLLKSATSN